MEENEELQAQPEQQPQEPHGDETDWKAECRKWERRAKENRESAEELKQAREDLAAAQAALEAEKQSRKLEAVRAKVAKGAASYLRDHSTIQALCPATPMLFKKVEHVIG